MATLPTPGSSNGTWGTMLNTFLETYLDPATNKVKTAALPAITTSPRFAFREDGNDIVFNGSTHTAPSNGWITGVGAQVLTMDFTPSSTAIYITLTAEMRSGSSYSCQIGYSIARVATSTTWIHSPYNDVHNLGHSLWATPLPSAAIASPNNTRYERGSVTSRVMLPSANEAYRITCFGRNAGNGANAVDPTVYYRALLVAW